MLGNPYVLIGAAGLWVATLIGASIKVNNLAVDRTDAKWIKAEKARDDAIHKKEIAAAQAFIDNEIANNANMLAMETKANEREKYIQGIRLANGRLVAAAGGLFDRNGRALGGSGVGGVPAPAGTASEVATAATGCRLSDETSGDLQDLAADAAGSESDAQLGHDYAVAVKAFRDAHQPKLRGSP